MESNRVELRLALCLALSAAALGVITEPGHAQRFELTPFVGWTSEIETDDESFSGADFALSLQLDEGSSYGLMGTYQLTERWLLEASLSRQPRDARIRFEFGSILAATRMDLDLYELGGQYQWTGEVFRPFVGFNVGQARLESEFVAGGTEDAWTVGAVTGVRALWRERLGLRFDLRYNTVLFDDDRDGALCRFFTCRSDLSDTTSDYVEIRTGVVIGFGGRDA